MLAAIGLVQIIGWVICGPQGYEKNRTTYKITLLDHDPERLEEQLRYEVLLNHWNTSCRPLTAVFVDGGLGEEARAVFESLSSDLEGAIICTPDELPDLFGS